MPFLLPALFLALQTGPQPIFTDGQADPAARGVWRSADYGWIIEIEEDTLTRWQDTLAGCYRTPDAPTARLMGQIEYRLFTREGDAIGLQYLDGDSNTRFERLPHLPERCGAEDLDTPSGVFEVFASAMQAHYAAVMGRVRVSAIYGSAVGFLTLSLLSLGLWMGGREVLSGRMSAGGLVAYLAYTGMLGSAASSLVSLYGRWANALGASRRVFGLMDLEPRPTSRPGALRLTKARGELRVEGLRFGYRPGQLVLDGIDLALAPGESLALVGPSGAGKSTLMQLVARFRDPDAGALRLDGIDLRDLDLSDLRRQIGWVPQNTQLFNATVADNLRIGRPEAELPALAAAARAANAHDFIAALPEGYATRVGERGLRLSGGQRQRLAIARAILADPRLLLLDEATSSLDSESERLVQEALEALMQGRTSIVIAHRLATVRRVDRIAVIDRGRIVEQGRHAELLAAGGLYARLCQLQLRA